MIALAIAQAVLVALGALLLVRRRPAHFVVAALVLQTLSMLWAMAVTPARYEPYFYARGGFPRTVQVLATSLGPTGVALVALVLAAGYVFRRRAIAFAALVLLTPARASADVVLMSAPTFPRAPAFGTSIANAYPKSAEGIDHEALADAFRAKGFEVRTTSAPRSGRAAPLPLLFLPIIDTPLARLLAPSLERAAHAGDPALIAREALQALARPHDQPLFLDVRFDATEPPYDVPAPFYVKYTDRERDANGQAPLRNAAAAAVDAAVAEVAAHATGTVIFTADHGLTPFESVPLVVRGTAAVDDVGLDVAQHNHVVLVRTKPVAPTHLPMYMVRDDRYMLVYRPERTGVVYTLYDLQADPEATTDIAEREPVMRAYLRGELWDRLHDIGHLVDEEGFALPPPARLPFRVVWTDQPVANGITFTDAHATDEATYAAVPFLETDGSRSDDRTIIVSAPVQPAPGSTPMPLILVVPGFAPRTVTARVGGGEVGPTLRELQGLEPFPRDDGRSLLPLMRGEPAEERAVFTEMPNVDTIYWGRRHLVVKYGKRAALYDVDADPREDHDLSREEPAVVEELLARLAAARSGVPMAGSRAALEPKRPTATTHLRFAGAGAVHRITGTIGVETESVEPVGISRDAYKIGPKRIDVAFTTSPNAVVGLDIPAANVSWQLYLDDAPWPASHVFAGCHGIATTKGFSGVGTGDVRATCPEVPALDPRADLGMLVTRSLLTR